MKIKAGNDIKLKCLCKDKDGVIISDLAAAADVVAQFKKLKADITPDIEKKKSAAQITIDDPTTGYLRIVIDAADTKDLSGNYYFAIEIQWAGDNQEMYLYDEDDKEFNTIEIIEHIIL